MKKRSIIILISILLIVCCYFGYKGFNLYYYNVDFLTDNYSEILKGIHIKDTIYLKHTDIKDNNYIEFNGIKVKNEFKKFTKLDQTRSANNSLKYALYGENKSLIASFWMGTTDTYVKILKSDKTLFGARDSRVTNANLTKMLEKNNINNDIELFRCLENKKNIKNNIFTSVKKMKENYTIQFMVTVMLPQIEDITLIDGDYEGYIFNIKNNIKMAVILKNDKSYVFTFLKTDYFTDEYIKEILNTVEID